MQARTHARIHNSYQLPRGNWLFWAENFHRTQHALSYSCQIYITWIQSWGNLKKAHFFLEYQLTVMRNILQNKWSVIFKTLKILKVKEGVRNLSEAMSRKTITTKCMGDSEMKYFAPQEQFLNKWKEFEWVWVLASGAAWIVFFSFWCLHCDCRGVPLFIGNTN